MVIFTPPIGRRGRFLRQKTTRKIQIFRIPASSSGGTDRPRDNRTGPRAFRKSTDWPFCVAINGRPSAIRRIRPIKGRQFSDRPRATSDGQKLFCVPRACANAMRACAISSSEGTVIPRQHCTARRFRDGHAARHQAGSSSSAGIFAPAHAQRPQSPPPLQAGETPLPGWDRRSGREPK